MSGFRTSQGAGLRCVEVANVQLLHAGAASDEHQRGDSKLIPVLLVERDLMFTRFLRESLSSLTSSEIELSVGHTLAEALQQLSIGKSEAILLDLCLSDSEGTQTFARIHEAVPSLPIVVLTCHEDEAFALQALRQGAQDYLLKSKIDGKILTRVTRYAIERKRIELKLSRSE